VARALVQHDALRLRFRVNQDSIVQFYGEPRPGRRARPRDAANAVDELERRPRQCKRVSMWSVVRSPGLSCSRCLTAIACSPSSITCGGRRLVADPAGGSASGTRAGGATRADPPWRGVRFVQAWSLALASLAAESESERGWWDGVERAPVCRLPYDAEGEPSLASDAREQRIALTVDDTEALLSRCTRPTTPA
jgi:hypothetical protein